MAKDDIVKDNFYPSAKSENLRKVFFDIKKKTDEMISSYNDVDFLETPAVPIRAIAKGNGIVAIEAVPRESIPERHATLENRIIKVDQEDSDEEKNFSIAHEVEHHIKGEADKRKKINALENTVVFPVVECTEMFNDKNVIKKAHSVVKQAARANYEKTIAVLKKIDFFNEIARPIARNVSTELGKNIPEDKALNSMAKLMCGKTIQLDDAFIQEVAYDLYNEEIADYFAANLLVPVERFVLWEDKSDKEIADAFKVSISCIEKRRKEVKTELEFLAV